MDTGALGPLLGAVSKVREESFNEEFFSLSSGLSNEPRSQLIKELLNQLKEAGCTIDTSRVVYGQCHGRYWPLILPDHSSVPLRLNIGTREGVFKSNAITLINYLRHAVGHTKSSVATRHSVSLAQAVLASSSAPSSSHSSSVVLRSVVRPLANSSFHLVAPPSYLPCPSNRGIPIAGGGKAFSLEELREHEIFLGDPPAPVNTLTIDQLVGARLYVYSGQRYLIMKDHHILAYSRGLAFADKHPTLKGFYKCGPHQYDDNPFKDRVICASIKLSDKEKLVGLLPYLNGIP